MTSLIRIDKKIKLTQSQRSSMYAKGYYKCTECSIPVKNDDAKQIFLNPKDGALYHEWCGKKLKIRPQAWVYRKFNGGGNDRPDIKRY
jgi:hypothetical protein